MNTKLAPKQDLLTKYGIRSREDLISITHGAGMVLVFWIDNKGEVLDAKGAHSNLFKSPKERKAAMKAGYIRGRVADLPDGTRLVHLYLPSEEMSRHKAQLVQALGQMNNMMVRGRPVVDDDTLIVPDEYITTIGEFMLE